MVPGSSEVNMRQKRRIWGKVDLLSFLFTPSKLYVKTWWDGLGKRPVFDICEMDSWASCRSSKPHYRLSPAGLISSAVFRRIPSFCVYHPLVLLPQLRNALVNGHSWKSEASPKDRGTIIWLCIVPVSIKFQHCLQSLSLFPWVIRQCIHSMGRARWEHTQL